MKEEKKILQKGNCPYCDAILDGGFSTDWGGSSEMFEGYKKRHEEGHPEYPRPLLLEELKKLDRLELEMIARYIEELLDSDMKLYDKEE